ncbi:C40 family peptidase [Candidatus Marifrigoribacter sp. Uisw_064]|jgi:cell wall-associated NlpC family hydrolase|uniref:C40 family peptidase n=1 Tax=Candidatus Marifrigoribacter sp. Uisw_064 TaxID=3230970 RepID=UPI003D488C5F
MKKILLLTFLSFLLISCGSSKSSSSSKTTKVERTSKSNSYKKTESIISYAKTFKGTRYKFGGTTKKGMDCSGLVYTSFLKEKISLPRVSRDMAKKGKRLSKDKISKGDLVFFKTNKNKNVINHVGLVVESKRGNILFIHSSSSRGVIVSSLDEKYWRNAFVEGRRVL